MTPNEREELLAIHNTMIYSAPPFYLFIQPLTPLTLGFYRVGVARQIWSEKVYWHKIIFGREKAKMCIKTAQDAILRLQKKKE